MPIASNFSQSRYDTSYLDSLRNLSNDFSTKGIQQEKLAQDAINSANDMAYKNARAKAQDAQNAVTNQMGYDSLGVSKEKIAIEQYNNKSKNQASYNALYQKGLIKEPYVDGVDYGTQFDNVMKATTTENNTKATAAQIAASNASTNLSNLTIDEVNKQNRIEKAKAEANVFLTTPQTKDVTNPEWNKNKDIVNNTTLVNPLDGGVQLDPSQITSLKQLSQKETELANLQKNSPVVSQGVGYNGPHMTVTPEVEKLTNEVNSLKSQVSPEVLQKVYPAVANGSLDKFNSDKALVDSANTFISNPSNQTIKDTRTPTKQETLAYFKSQGADAITLNAIAQQLNSGDNTNNGSGLSSLGSGSSNSPISSQVNKILGNDTKDAKAQIYFDEHNKKLLGEKEQYAVNFNKYGKALQDAGINVNVLKTNDGLEKAIKENLTPDGLPKNSTIVKEKLLATSLNDFVSKNKDDSDNNSSTNISQFIDSNKAVLSQIPTQELESFLAGVQSDYKNQGTFLKNLSDGSPIGDALDNRIKIWNQSHPKNLQLSDSQIGKFMSDN